VLKYYNICNTDILWEDAVLFFIFNNTLYHFIQTKNPNLLVVFKA